MAGLWLTPWLFTLLIWSQASIASATYHTHSLTCTEGTNCQVNVGGSWYTYYGTGYQVYACTGNCKHMCQVIARTSKLQNRWHGDCKAERARWGGGETGRERGRLTLVTAAPYVVVSLTDPQINDTGAYWLGVELRGADSYARLIITVRPKPAINATLTERVASEENDDIPDVWLTRDPAEPRSPYIQEIYTIPGDEFQKTTRCQNSVYYWPDKYNLHTHWEKKSQFTFRRLQYK